MIRVLQPDPSLSLWPWNCRACAEDSGCCSNHVRTSGRGGTRLVTSPCRRTAERRVVAVESDGTLTNNTLEIFHSPVEKMEDKSDNDGSVCEDGLRNKRNVRKRRSTRKASAGRETTSRTTIIAPGHHTKTSNSDSCEDENLDGHDGFLAKQFNIKVKEEVSSGDEETYGKGEHESFREVDTSGKEERHVSSRESDISGKREEHVSSGEEDATSGDKDLGNIKTVLVQNSPVTQRKQKRRTSKFGVVRSKEISEDLRKQVVEAHKSGKGYKKIAKDLDMNLSTVKGIISKWKKFSTVVTLPRSGRPTKISAQARNTILKHMRDNTRVTAKDLKASLALANINVHESTIRKTLNKWCSRDFTMEEDTAVQQE